MKHTKGPWKIVGSEIWAGSRRITIGHGSYDEKDRETRNANARLIASAPDMEVEIEHLKAINDDLLGTCKLAVDYLKNGFPNIAQDRLEKAIAKAEGKEL